MVVSKHSADGIQKKSKQFDESNNYSQTMLQKINYLLPSLITPDDITKTHEGDEQIQLFEFYVAITVIFFFRIGGA